MDEGKDRAVLGLAAFQALDALACAVPNRYITDALDNVDCPPVVRQVLPLVKAAAAAGLLLGRRDPRLGRLTTRALQAYFVIAIGLHVREAGRKGVVPAIVHGVPAVGMLRACTVAGRAFHAA